VPGAAALVLLLHRVRGLASLRLGDRAAAVAAFERSLEAARSRRAPFDAALSLRGLAACGAASGERSPEDHLEESEEILRGLGVGVETYQEWGSLAVT